MLDANRTGLAASDESEDAVRWRRLIVVTNAIRASQQMTAENPDADTAALQAALEQLQSGDLPSSVSMEVRDALLSMKAVHTASHTGYAD